jgi:hypothetical protein
MSPEMLYGKIQFCLVARARKWALMLPDVRAFSMVLARQQALGIPQNTYIGGLVTGWGGIPQLRCGTYT